MLATFATGFYHLKLGLQVVIEDYVHTEWLKVGMLIVNAFACILLAAASMLAVLKLFLGA
jgi:succinate dehydrogenase / fumarate reductase membrane anchor subunit